MCRCRSLNLNINIDSYELLILGDLNARIVDKGDYFTFQTDIPDLEEYEDILSDDFPKRTTCDKVVNTLGLIN